MNEYIFDIEIRDHERTVVSLEGLRFARNRITFLLGESGIGKTLASRAIFGLLEPDEWDITVNHEPYRAYLAGAGVKAMRREGFFVFQEPSTHLNPLKRIGEQLQEGDLAVSTRAGERLRELWKPEVAAEADRLLDLYPRPYRPSGGEKQRILLAMALSKLDIVQDGAEDRGGGVFIFDEPTGSLDNEYRDLFVTSLLRRYRRRSFTILFITHDYSLLRYLTGEHADLVRRMDFRELSKDGGQLVFREFRPSTYTEWLERLRRERSVRKASASVSPVLEVGSGLTVAGRTLMLSSDPEGRNDTSLRVFPGWLAYLKAPSGTGKTMLAKAAIGLFPASGLHETLCGTQIPDSAPSRFWQKHVWGKTMTMAFQHADEALNMHSSVAETILRLPVRRKVTRAAVRDFLTGLFELASVPELMKKKVWMLSGGQKQKLNLLRALFLDTDVLILDEPLNGLDFESCVRVTELLKGKLSAGKGILMISHNEEIFDALADPADRFYLRVRPPANGD